MKCNNCNFKIVDGAKFCENCGIKINEPQSGVSSLDCVSIKKGNKKLFIIVGIILAVIVAIVSVVIVINKNNKFNDPFKDIENLTTLNTFGYTKEYKELNSFVRNIEQDYSNANISKDDYIMQLAYSIYDTSKLNTKYKKLSLDYKNPVDLFKKAFAMQDELSNDTLIYILKKYTLSDVVWDVKKRY